MAKTFVMTVFYQPRLKQLFSINAAQKMHKVFAAKKLNTEWKLRFVTLAPLE